MKILEVMQTTFTDMNIISAITSTMFIILLGYYCRKKGIFSDQVGKMLSRVVLSVALPALALKAFMNDIDQESLAEGMGILIWGIAIYIILIIVTKPMYAKFKGDKEDTLRVLTIFGSTTFFGIPIVGAIYGAEGVLYASIFNIGYRIFLYSYGYIKMSGLKMEAKNLKEMFLNPIVIATFVGLFIWVFQDSLPQMTVVAADGTTSSVAFLRIDQTAPWLFNPMTYLAGLASPLAWLAIGSTLGSIDFKTAITDRTSIVYSANKVILVPILNIVVLAILSLTGILTMSAVSVGTIVIMMAAPTATVAAAYAISFDKDALLASNASLLSTISAVVMIPIWIIVINMITSTNLFG
ncbi:malate permease [Virgibacillus pantothenticus]|uniref:Malate permease n=1 Tax=Virgibacillus pantothenticus TaxID=1473 RepID=A0A0L0QTS0_VIRPA|nr:MULTISPECIES: AEC family transporter [Virgibacillus]API90991.1 malate permease [Virgibacillus sp. 6R]KNE22050.1 malate permease [Virgibacillus pantothenticus]MBS7428974.1 AEC family transporter [Virgibacillus sp. 19R1-5]MBU8566727.1 AEC family transporter [Virgibacillus pantothenticus]MBU8600310.1 AEC family transporter [Virgibacillus pantothenticus]